MPTLVQRAGRAAMRPDELLRGFVIPVGARSDDPFPPVEYDGRPFMGWQRQPHGRRQQAIEEAIQAITREAVTLHAAGRTDTGVHALAMTAHVDIARPIAAHRLADGTNAKLGGRCRWRSFAPRRRRGFPRPVQLRRPPLFSTGSSTAARPWPSMRTRLARAGRPSCRCDEPGGAAARRPSRFHHLPLGPVPGRQPGQDARPADRAAPRRRDRDRGGGALLPPPPGPVDGRLPGAGRPRQVDGGGSRGRPRGARPRGAGLQCAARRALFRRGPVPGRVAQDDRSR